MKAIIYLKIFLITLVMSGVLHAQALKCSKGGTVLFYINGVDNDQSDFNKSKAELVGLFSAEEKKNVDSQGLLEVEGQHNKTEGLTADIFETIQARAEQIFGTRTAAKKIAALIIEGKEMQDKQIKQKVLERYQAFALMDAREEDLLSAVTQINSHLHTGRKVILVSHSQGNLYANDSYLSLQQILTQENRSELLGVFGNFQVASPTYPNNPKSRMFKLLNDHITGILGPLGNYSTSVVATIPFLQFKVAPDDPWKNHGFLEVYLANNLTATPIGTNTYKTTRQISKDLIVELAEEFDDNCAQFEILGPDSLVKTQLGSDRLVFTYSVADSFFTDRQIEKDEVRYEWRTSGLNNAPVSGDQPTFSIEQYALSSSPDIPSYSSGYIYVELTLINSADNSVIGKTYKISTWACQGEGCCGDTYRYVDTSLGHQCISPPGASIWNCGGSFLSLNYGAPGAPDQWPTCILTMSDGTQHEQCYSFPVEYRYSNVPPFEGATTWTIKVEAKDFWGGSASATCTYHVGGDAEYIQSNNVTDPQP